MDEVTPRAGVVTRWEAMGTRRRLVVELGPSWQGGASAGMEELKKALEAHGGMGEGAHVVLAVTVENWHALEEVAALCNASGAGLELRAAGAGEEGSVVALQAEEQAAFYVMLESLWPELSDGTGAARLEEGQFDRLLGDVRRAIMECTEEFLAHGGDRGGGSGGSFSMPGLDHAMLEDPARRRETMRRIWSIAHSASVRGWLASLSLEETGGQALAASPWLRVFVKRVARDTGDEGMLEVLRRVYGADEERTAFLEEEASFLEETGLGDAGREVDRDLGLDRPARRRRPFRVPPHRPAGLPAGGAEVTVLVPAYRHECFIEEALHSALGQEGPGLAVLVVDDGSPDGTAIRARSVKDPRLEVVVNERNLGLGGTLALALERVRTEFVAVLNSDDLFHPERMARCLDVLREDPEARIVGTDVALIDVEGGVLTTENVSWFLDGRNVHDWVHWYASERPREAGGDPLFRRLLERNVLATSSNIVCRTAFLRRHASTFRGLRYCVDWFLFLEGALEETLRILPEPLLAYRLHRSNTVWFGAAPRWPYYLEVNRVAAGAVERWIERVGAASGERVEAVLEAVSRHLSRNTEVDGLGLYLAGVLSPSELQAVAEDRPRAAQLLASVERMAAAYHRFRGCAGDRPEDMDRILMEAWAAPRLKAAGVLGAIRERELQAVKGAEAFLRGHVRELEADKSEAWSKHDALGRRLEQLSVELEQAISEKSNLLDERKVLLEEREALRAERDDLATVRGELEARNVSVERELIEERVARRQEADALRTSREWSAGDLLWNRMRLAVVSRRAKKWYRKLRSWRDAGALNLDRLRSGRNGRPRIVFTAVPWFPEASHTFVYQEIHALRQAGMKTKMFCWRHHRKVAPPEPFQWLAGECLELQHVPEYLERDLRWFKRNQPARLESFLARVSEATGWSAGDLEKGMVVRQACTFARMAGSWGAHYIHSYFFYDHSFMAMMAAWLLGLPRGITCYADHLLGDYPFKMVPLHLQTADLVVATSARIKRELLDVGGESVEPKILLKPNGVDCTRFSAVAHGRQEAEAMRMISVSRIEPKKGLVALAGAIRLLADRGCKVVLDLVGDVHALSPGSLEYGELLRRRIAEWGIQDRVVFHGWQAPHRVVELLQAAHVFVAPYVELATGDKDGIPTALLEAMAAGLPSVTTDAGSIPEAVADGQEALVVAQNDPEALAAALVRLAGDPALCAKLGARARARCLEEFDVKVTEVKLRERIETLVAERKR